MDNEKSLNKYISNRINYYLNEQNKTQQELADYMGVSQVTVSNWSNGKKIPRMDKIDKITKFFNINRSDLMGLDNEQLEEPQDRYYYDDDVAEMAQELKDNSDMKVLFDVSRDISKEDMDLVVQFIKRLKK